MPRRLGEQPLTNAEKQARQRARVKERLESTQDAVAFILALRPGRVPAGELAALQRRLEALRR